MDVETINKKLLQEEDWLRNFESNVSKSARLREGIETILDDFSHKLQLLQENVMSKHEENGKIQLKQHNIQKLIKAIDTTIQFYGRSSELESTIRDGLPSHDLEAYIEAMDCLQQAIDFFQNHPEKRLQLENMKMTLETGFSVLEKEYRSVVAENSVQADPAAVIESLDEHAEILPGRFKSIHTVKNADKVARLGDWLLLRGRDPRFLSHYSEIRGEHMRRVLSAVLDVHRQQNANSKDSRFVKQMKRTYRSERYEKEPKVAVNVADEAEATLILFGCLLALITAEEHIMEKTLSDVGVRAQVHRDLVSRPLSFCIRSAERAISDSDGLTSQLPLLRYLSNHHNQLHTLAQNSGQDTALDSLLRCLRVKCSSLLNEFVERLKTDGDKFVPEDGNVHPMTANTLSLLCLLTLHRQTVTHQLLAMTAAPAHNTQLLMPKLFARILSALGTALQRKTEFYSDPNLASLFMLNNYNYIAKGLQDEEDALLPVISEQNHQILEFYLSQITTHEQNYLSSWQPVVGAVSGADRVPSDEKQVLKNMILNFNREFESQLSLQRNYCISDPLKADQVRRKVKRMLVPRYSTLVEKYGADGPDAVKVVRYSEESVDVMIDRLFDATA